VSCRLSTAAGTSRQRKADLTDLQQVGAEAAFLHTTPAILAINSGELGILIPDLVLVSTRRTRSEVL
jgi:hypothetical protein